MGDRIPNPGMKIMWMGSGDHRTACEKHKAEPWRPYEVEVASNAGCWWCLRQTKAKPEGSEQRP